MHTCIKIRKKNKFEIILVIYYYNMIYILKKYSIKVLVYVFELLVTIDATIKLSYINGTIYQN